MKIVIPGGSGQVGTVLARWYQQMGHEVVVFSRQSYPAAWRVVQWDAQTLGAWAEEIEGADVVINLTGRSVNCRYTPQNRQEIKQSRVQSTELIGQAISQANRPPHLWLQASTATIYAHRFDAPNDEYTGILGGREPHAPDTWRFSIDVATSWEQAMQKYPTPYTRQLLLRSAMTMSPDPEGVFDTLLWLVRRGLGGAVGNGQQYVSWIHDLDFCRAVNWLIKHEELSGPVNLAAPHPLPNHEFMRVLRQAYGQKFGLPAAAWMVEIGTFVLRTESELILKSRRVVPTKLVESGFTFHFPHWSQAAADLCHRWQTKQTHLLRS